MSLGSMVCLVLVRVLYPVSVGGIGWFKYVVMCMSESFQLFAAPSL
ncbi:unnamed protein product [Brassica oleracea]